MKELAKTYDPQAIEDKIYERWESKKYFSASVDPARKPYTIVMPPPNITGQLHMGHALDNTLQDILIRYRRMQGYSALWLPGTDHASIATEAKVVEAMRAEGLTKDMLGREGFLEKAWAWKNRYGSRIVQQLRKMGSSCDWDRERFTMDEGCSAAVRDVFVKLYEQGLIYRGNRMVNWCPRCRTSISDAEVEYETQNSHFWHLLYPVKETGELLELATSRPETMLGDTAVAINPDDPRYAHLHGCHVILPLVGRELPIVCDEHADMTKGTGVVKITPAHDPNDFEVGRRHQLPMVRMLTYDGRLTGAEDAREAEELRASGRGSQDEPEVFDCGKYAGMTAVEARRAIVADLEAGGFLKKTEPLSHDVGTCYRCHTTIEPMVSRQWFVKMEPLAGPAVKAVEEGRIRFVPERFTKLYLNWMSNTRDWCISRQLWWGHRIPAWYCDDCGGTVVSREDPCCCPSCGGTLRQDPDTLDTWFSSALWPFSTLGWPEDTEDLRYFYPTDTLVTGYDIIGFCVSRMIFSGLAYTGKEPFHTVLIHGLVRDSLGRKMSKSLGNGVDPLEVIAKYGADALRMTLCTGNSPGNDMRFYWERVEASRNFMNKVWNASRFMMMNMDGVDISAVKTGDLRDEDKWILSRMNDTVQAVTENMDRFELGIALQKVYDFVWDEFCDWYIEMVKPRFYGESAPESRAAAAWTLSKVLITSLKLLHPFVPFVTEEIFGNLQDREETIMLSAWPVWEESLHFAAEERRIDAAREVVRAVRTVRVNMNVPASRRAHLYLVTADEEMRQALSMSRAFIASLAGASEVTLQADRSGIGEDAVQTVTSVANVFLPLSDLVDIAKETERLHQEEKRLLAEIARCDGMLNNEKFIGRAPAAKIEAEKEKRAKYARMLEEVRLRLAQLG